MMPKIVTGPVGLALPGISDEPFTKNVNVWPTSLVKLTVWVVSLNVWTCNALLEIGSFAPEVNVAPGANVTLDATKYMLSMAFITAKLFVMLGSNGSGCGAGRGLLVLRTVTLCSEFVNAGAISSRPL